MAIRRMPFLSQVGTCLPWLRMGVFALSCSLESHLCFFTSQDPEFKSQLYQHPLDHC